MYRGGGAQWVILCEHVGFTSILPVWTLIHGKRSKNFALLSIGSKYTLVENISLFNLKLSSILCPNLNMYIGQYVNSKKIKIIKFIPGAKELINLLKYKV